MTQNVEPINVRLFFRMPASHLCTRVIKLNRKCHKVLHRINN